MFRLSMLAVRDESRRKSLPQQQNSDRIYPAILQGRQDVQDRGRVGSDMLTPCESTGRLLTPRVSAEYPVCPAALRG